MLYIRVKDHKHKRVERTVIEVGDDFDGVVGLEERVHVCLGREDLERRLSSLWLREFKYRDI